MTLDELRIEIDKIDDKLLELYNQRMELVYKVGELKNKTSSPIYRPEREQAILNRLKRQNSGKLTNEAIDALFLELFTVARNLELPERVAYLGPEATFTHQAAESIFGATSSYLPISSINGIFKEISRGTAKFGVVPIENSSNGIVSDTIHSLDTYNLKIIAEVILDVKLSFAGLSSDIKRIKKIYSKDVAFAQCRIFLENLGLDKVEYIPVESTVKGVKLALKDKESGAICPKVASTIYNLPLIFDDIQDNNNNKTRFFVVSDFDNLPSGSDKTSILVRLPNKAGSLVDFLNDFKKAEINLMKIKSHIIGEQPLFFIEFDGHKDDEKIQWIVKKHKKWMKILGSYVKKTDDI